LRILMVHPVMWYLGGGESLCCETMNVLASLGHNLTLLSEPFDSKKTESFLGFEGLFSRINLLTYRLTRNKKPLGSYSHILSHTRGQRLALKSKNQVSKDDYDLIFSSQDPAYIPDLNLPVVQWGYFPRTFPNSIGRGLFRTVRDIPLRMYYQRKIGRIGLVLAISEYSKTNFDREWNRPSMLVYPPSRMVRPGSKRNLIVTAGRAVPEKRLHLLWNVARMRPQYDFFMMAIKDAYFVNYSQRLSDERPSNGRIIFNATKEMYYRNLSEAKVYVHLMENERFGITIVEAMSASCVPIVHDSGAPREIVDSTNGFRWRQIEDLPEIIDQAIRMAPSEAASQRASHFSDESFEKRLSSIFAGLRLHNST
jgi:glycosyltransferase involved in cell wall biosynthesis